MDSLKQFTCVVCEKSFKKRDHMTRHMMTHSGEKPYQCDVCERSYYRNDHLISHKRTHTGETPYRCNLCEKSFLTKQNLTVHQRLHTGELPFSCEYCEKSYSSKGNLKTHQKVHTGDTQCDICYKTFSSNGYLIIHKKVHTDGKPFKCDVCEDSFSSKSDFNIHKKSVEHWKRIENHDIDIPQTHIDYINFVESIKFQDVKEEQSVEDNSEPKPYPCDLCGKTFNQRHHVKSHRLVHSREKAYSCDICEKSFARKDTLNRHKRTHLPIKADENPKSSNNMFFEYITAGLVEVDHIEGLVSNCQEEMKEGGSDDPSFPIIKEEFKDSDVREGVEDSILVDCSEYLQVQMDLTN